MIGTLSNAERESFVFHIQYRHRIRILRSFHDQTAEDMMIKSQYWSFIPMMSRLE